jgi:demethylmenaquinone methyltransferase/2-methoxy-6-polyprenyl-1,4-benzoquinol methylase
MKLSHKAVSSLYDNIFGYYEIVNSLLTFGLDRYWRFKTAKLLKTVNSSPNPKILDICCGTGDFTFLLSKIFYNSSITACDLNENMLAKAKNKDKFKKINFLLSNCSDLPFQDETFDIITISFATRNIAVDKESFAKTLKEILRVLRKGGIFISLETTQPENYILKNLMRIYVKISISILNILNPGARNSYLFLKNSILNFYTKKELAEAIGYSGFSSVYYETLFPGAVAIHIATK